MPSVGPGTAVAGYSARTSTPPGVRKVATGISGLDEVTGGGLPRGRPTLICGPAGCGKTLLAMEFLVRGITEFGEPGVFIAFEEPVSELVENVVSLGFDLQELQDTGLLVMDHICVLAEDVQETGGWDLEGLMIRIGAAIDQVGAQRVVLDTVEVLFGAFPNESSLRAELRRLFAWLKLRGVTAVITGERGDGTLTRFGIEEYVSDCVIVLDHRVNEQTSTRRLRVLKYRGSLHGTNEYPFLIGAHGVSVLPITSLGLQHAVSTDRVSTGMETLDEMLGGSGLFKGSSVLISGTAGFTWRYGAKPTLMSRSYSMRIKFRTGKQPEVYVDQPDLVSLADGRKIPHVYSQSPTWLCLHRPVKGEWRPDMLIDRSIVPWATLWLFYFEEWLASNEWKGGGEHFGADHAPHGTDLQEGI